MVSIYSYTAITPPRPTMLTLKNSLAKISFCDRECYNINNNKTKEAVLKHITTTFNIQVIDKQYVSLNPQMMRNILSHEHMIATFTNGNPYLLWLTVIDGEPYTMYIDRKLKEGYSYPKIHVVNYRFAEELYHKDTLLTGELVRDVNRNWQFIISDILLYKGQAMKQKNVLARFQQIYNLLETQYTPDTITDICPIRVKRLFQYSELKHLFNEFIPSLSYVCKGLVFYTMNNQFSNYAWVLPKEDQQPVKRKHEADAEFLKAHPEYASYKDVLENQAAYVGASDEVAAPGSPSNKTAATALYSDTSVQLYIVKTEIPDIYNLYTKDDRKTRQSIAFIPDLKTSQMLHTFFKTATELDVVASCRYHYYFRRWIPTELHKKGNPSTQRALAETIEKLNAAYTGPTVELD